MLARRVAPKPPQLEEATAGVVVRCVSSLCSRGARADADVRHDIDIRRGFESTRRGALWRLSSLAVLCFRSRPRTTNVKGDTGTRVRGALALVP